MYLKSSISLITIFMLVGCGGGNSNTQNSLQTQNDISKRSVTVERGALYHAKVVDANGQIAMDNGTNTYTFAKNIVYPVSVKQNNDGTTFVDVDGDKKASIGDMDLDITLKSCSSNITPITTIVANKTNCDKTKIENEYKQLSKELNVDISDLKNLPSHIKNTHGIAIQNAAYLELHNKNKHINYTNLKDQVNIIDGYINSSDNYHQIEQSVLNHNNHKTYTKDNASTHKSHSIDKTKYQNRMIDNNGTIHYKGDGHTNHMQNNDGKVHHNQDGHSNHIHSNDGTVHYNQDGHSNHILDKVGKVHHSEDGHNNHNPSHK